MAEFPTFADSACKYLRLNSENPHEKAAKIGAIWSGQVLAEISRENGMPILDAEFFRIPARRAASASLVPDTFDTRGVAPAVFGLRLCIAAAGRILRYSGLCLAACPFARETSLPDTLVCTMHGATIEAICTATAGTKPGMKAGVYLPDKPCTVAFLLPDPHTNQSTAGRKRITGA